MYVALSNKICFRISSYPREYIIGYLLRSRNFCFILRWNSPYDVLPYHVYLQFVPVDDVNLLENVVNIPHLDASVDARRHDAVPVTDGQRLQLDNPREVCVQHLHELRSLERPNV